MTNESLETYGWDCVFALPVGDANAAIVAAKSTPPRFDYTNSDHSVVGAAFGPWQIAGGGDGMSINLSLPLTGITVTAGGTTSSFDSGSATVAVNLGFVPPPPPETGSTGNGTSPSSGGTQPPASPPQPTTHDLMVAPAPSIEVSGLTTSPAISDGLTEARLRVGLGDWLAANLPDFDHVFASITLNAKPADTGFDWLVPTTSAYAYTENADGTGGLLAVMCMTGGHPATGTLWQADPSLLPAGTTASFAITMNRLLGDIVKPNLKLAFPNSTDTSWSLDEATSRLTLTKAFDLPAVNSKDAGGDDKSYTASLTACEISLRNAALIIDMTTQVEITPGIMSICHHVDAYTIGLVTKKDGTLTLGYAKDDANSMPPDYSATQDHIKVDLPQLLAKIAIIIGGLIIIIATEGAATVPVLIIGGLLFGATELIPNMIETIKLDDAPSIDPLSSIGTTVSWTSTRREFRPSSATLGGGLLLAGAFVDAAVAATV